MTIEYLGNRICSVRPSVTMIDLLPKAYVMSHLGGDLPPRRLARQAADLVAERDVSMFIVEQGRHLAHPHCRLLWRLPPAERAPHPCRPRVCHGSEGGPGAGAANAGRSG